MIIPEKIFSRHATILDSNTRRTVLAQATAWCESSSYAPAKARGALFRSMVTDLDELDHLRSELNDVRLGCASEIGGLRSELNGIKASFIYRTMKSLASKIDRFFPDKTRRGELRKRVTRYLKADEYPAPKG